MSVLSDLISDLKTVYHLAKPIRGDSHQERLENFYRTQSTDYDRFRRRLLKGREELYQSLADGDSNGSVWVDFGGGTGSNLESIADRLSKFSKIYIVDLSPSLLEVARGRIADRGWTNVTTVEADITQFLPPEGVADIVTFSYSLTMIPEWFAAIEQAEQILKPGGIIGVVDFYVSHKHPPQGWQRHSFLARHFWPIWFATDNVFLCPNRLGYLHHKFDTVSLTEKMGNLPFLPGFKVPYYRFIGRKRAKT
ncbi:class I SAM-dependent methyltransferase [Moorena sp. SIO3A2]|uniref:class I SAM-dependent methyltransferase n=1 Tax=Moorena sp. SIO3A2 TaxID=2607841 RepID=UPI0013B6FB10|nr:class I SAM-dependent methyltransferase [Moorena sp. SIO3A2]NER87303.1 class I SAM-dependent methyltransferase [Moorena sp. SIO3A2]